MQVNKTTLLVIGVSALMLSACTPKTTSSSATESTMQTSPSPTISTPEPTPTPTSEAVLYEELLHKDHETYETRYLVYKGSDTSEVFIEKLLRDIEKNNCKVACNLYLYDNREAALLEIDVHNGKKTFTQQEKDYANAHSIANIIFEKDSVEGTFIYYKK
ncbi:MAG TPA: hypothetical protein VD999_05805 [Vitreimonas sp.]|nr:hypothetical protein [Vitreimonas sp.]